MSDQKDDTKEVLDIGEEMETILDEEPSNEQVLEGNDTVDLPVVEEDLGSTFTKSEMDRTVDTTGSDDPLIDDITLATSPTIGPMLGGNEGGSLLDEEVNKQLEKMPRTNDEEDNMY